MVNNTEKSANLLKIQGMDEANVEKVRLRDGRNALAPPPTTPEWIKFLKHTFSGFGILLMLGGILCLICWLINLTSDSPSNDNVIDSSFLIV